MSTTVPISLARTSVAVSVRHGIPRSALLGRPSITERELARGGRVSWDAFCEFASRLELAWADHGGLERFARAFSPELPEIRAIVRAIATPRQVLELMLSLGGWAHPSLQTRTSELPDGRLELTIAIPEALRDNPAFFRITALTVAQAPAVVGLPAAEVELELAPRLGRMRFATAPGRTLFTRARETVDELSRVTMERILELQEEVRALRHAATGVPPDPMTRARELGERWRLTPRQTQVLAGLSRGGSNREIAAQLGLSDRTVELHVTAILKRSGLENRTRLAASFWTAT